MKKFKAFLKTAWKKIKCAVKEIFNFLTNLICPVMSALCILAELLNLPTSWIKGLKKAEYWCWQVAGTKDAIENFVDKVEDAVEETAEE